MPHNRRLCLGPFGEVHNSRDLLATLPPYGFGVRQQTTIIYVDPVVIWEISDQAIAAVYQTYCVHSLVWARSPIVG
jgi:hypothetical protein